MKSKINDSSKMHVAIVCAVHEEFVALSSQLSIPQSSMIGDKKIISGTYQGKNILVIQSGIGNINSAIATSAAISVYNPDILLFSGIAGALNPSLEVGHVLVGRSAFQAEAISHEQLRMTWEMPPLHKPADTDLLQKAESLYADCSYFIKTGVIVSSDIYPAPKDYVTLFEEQSADAIDMETAAFYQTCNAFSKPCLCIRSFSNPVTNSEHEELESSNIMISSTNSSEFCFRLIKQLSFSHDMP